MDIVKIGNQYYDSNGEEYDFTDIREEEIWILQQENKKLKEENQDLNTSLAGAREVRKRLDYAINKLTKENKKLKEELELSDCASEKEYTTEQLTDKKGHIFSHPEDVEWSNSLITENEKLMNSWDEKQKDVENLGKELQQIRKDYGISLGRELDQLDEIRKLKKELELRDCGSEEEAKARGLI